ncbi:MAG: hypothetical protein R3F19_33430 [Verrucomicrobiales bacterium]
MRQALDQAPTEGQRSEIQRAVTYFANNKHRKNYSENVKDKLDRQRSHGSRMQRIIKQRLARPGCVGKRKGCASVLTLRALNRTGGRWDQFWSKISGYGVPTC